MKRLPCMQSGEISARGGNWEENWSELIQPNTDREIVKKLQYRLERSYQVDRNGREIMRGDRVTGLFYNGRPITGVCGFSREHSAWGIRWNRGGVAEFTPFCCTCNVEWEVEEDGKEKETGA